MIQDILPLHLENTYTPKPPRADSIVLGFRGEGILQKNDQGEIEFPTYGLLQKLCACEMPMVYLFSIGEIDYFLSDLSAVELPGYSYLEMPRVRSLGPKNQVFAAATAWHLYVWYRDNQFCGRCGARLSHGSRERKLDCPQCGNEVFPKVAPAVIVAVTDGDKLLLTKYARGSYRRYALIAGFTEIGETLEETVRREVFEETGVQVKNIRYYKSQPWGFASNLLAGYFCELDGPAALCIDREELSMAEWVHYEDVPEDDGMSLTREMMAKFKAQQKALKG